VSAVELSAPVCPGAAGGGPRASRAAEHDLLDVLTIAIAAAICGADSLAAAEPFGRAKQRWLEGFLRLRNGIPPAEAFCGVFAALRPAGLSGCLRGAAAEIGRRLRRRSPGPPGDVGDEPGGPNRAGAALPPVSVRTTPGEICLVQEAGGHSTPGGKSLPELLGVLDLAGAVVAVDAVSGTFNFTVGRGGPGRESLARENFALLHRLAVATLKRVNDGRGSVVGKRAVAASNNDFLERALLAFPAA
jgi:DDE_Tnp_1-associated